MPINSQQKQMIKVDLFKVIQDARNHHGLKHQDYDTYRYFCSNKLGRIRKSMGIKSNGRPLYDKIASNHKTIMKQFEAYLFESERAYSHAESLKPNMSHSHRTKFHVSKRLMRGTQYSKLLLECSENGFDNLTIMQSKIYHQWMSALYDIQIKQFEHAKTNLISSMAYITVLKEQQYGHDSFSLEAISILEDPIRQLIRYISHQFRTSEDTITHEIHNLSSQLRASLDSEQMKDVDIPLNEFSIQWIQPGTLININDPMMANLIKPLYETNKPKLLLLIKEFIDSKSQYIDDTSNLELAKSNVLSWREILHSANNIHSIVSDFIILEYSISRILYQRLKSLLSINSMIGICAERRLGCNRKKRFRRSAIFSELINCLERINQLGIVKENLLIQRTMRHMINIYQVELLIVNALDALLKKNHQLAAKCVLVGEKQLDTSIKDMPLYSECLDMIGIPSALESDQMNAMKHVLGQLGVHIQLEYSIFKNKKKDPLSLEIEPLSPGNIPGYLKEIMKPRISYLKPIFYDLAYDQIQYPSFSDDQDQLHLASETTETINSSESRPASSTSEGLTGLLKRWWSTSPVNK